MRAAITTLCLFVFSVGLAVGGIPEKPVVYNNVGGDGSAALDRDIKAAYSARYRIVDTAPSTEFTEPQPTQGSLPTTAADPAGRPLSGFVLAAYIVNEAGVVTDTFILKTTDRRLSDVVLEAMSHWRFTPATLNGTAVATTAAQDFTFGTADGEKGFRMDHLAVYQDQQVLLKRLPGPDVFGAYVKGLERIAHNFFIGDAVPRRLAIVVVLRPANSARVWFVSSTQPADSRQLEPLRTLLQAFPAPDIREGPVAFALQARIAGAGETAVPREESPSVPKEWRDARALLQDRPAFSSDEFLNAVCKEVR